MSLHRRRFLQTAATLTAVAPWWAEHAAAAEDHAQTAKAARGQTVYFNAWAGSERINAYLQWAGAELKARHDVTLRHVKITDTAEVVQRVRAEKAAGRREGGSVDLVWINGENFLAMKREGLLYGPFAEALPNFAWVDTANKPTTRMDFAEPVEGMEAPWGMAQLTFQAVPERAGKLPTSLRELLDWARAHPGRFTYPRPPQFLGTTFVKQVLLETAADASPLYQPMTEATWTSLSAAVWRYLDELHPHLWRQGRQFPTNAAALQQMLADGETAIAFTFNPNDAANGIAGGSLPAETVSYQHAAGTVGNTHFVAIPFNARARAGAQVVANFLMSPVAQARKADLAVWGDPTVLAVQRLPAEQRALFGDRPAPGQVRQPAPVLPEPHASWVEPLEQAWLHRYGQ